MKKFSIPFVFISGIFLLFNCSGDYKVVLGVTNDADISFTTSIDSTTLNSVTEKIKSLSSSENKVDQVTFFDQAQFTKGLNNLKGIQGVSVKKDSHDTIIGSFSVMDLTKLEPANSSPKLFTISRSQNKTTLSFNLSKENAKTAFQLFPGISSSVIEAISPPALYEDELTQEEYRQNLLLFFGKNHITAVDNSKYTIQFIVPGTIISSSGLKVSGNKATCSFSLLDLLVLDKPIHFQISWN